METQTAQKEAGKRISSLMNEVARTAIKSIRILFLVMVIVIFTISYIAIRLYNENTKKEAILLNKEIELLKKEIEILQK